VTLDAAAVAVQTFGVEAPGERRSVFSRRNGLVKIAALGLKRAEGMILNGNGRTVKNVGLGAALMALTGYLATEVYGNLKAADLRIERDLAGAILALRDDAKERRELSEKRWDKQGEVNDAVVRALEAIRVQVERKP